MLKKRKKGLRALALAAALLVATVGFAPSAHAAGANVAKVGAQEYPTVQQAVDAASSIQGGATVELLSGVTFADGQYITLSKAGANVTIDLAGHKLTMNAMDTIAVKNSNINLIVKNGEISNSHADGYGLYIYDGGKLATGEVIPHRNVNVQLEGLTMTTLDQGVGVNGNNIDCNVVLKACAINATGSLGAYWPAKTGTLTIDGTTITAGTGVTVKGGNLVINDSKIVATGAKVTPDKYYPGSGNLVLTGDAIYVESGYNDRKIDVKVNSGVFTSANANSMQYYAKPSEVAPDRTIAANGGTFSDTSALQFAGDKVALKDDKGFTVTTPEEAKASGAVSSVVKDGKTVYFVNNEEAKDFAGTGENAPVVTPVTYTVSFDVNGATGTVASQTVNAGEFAKDPAAKLENKGFTFAGWFVDGSDTAFDFAKTPVTSDLKLVAKWNKVINKYTVTFDDGLGNKTVVEVEDGKLVAEPKAPEYKGWKLSGWYSNKAADGTLSGKWDFAKNTVSGDMTLYAGWVKDASSTPAVPGEKPQNPTPELPKTGDASMFMAAAAAISGLVAAGAGIASRKRK